MPAGKSTPQRTFDLGADGLGEVEVGIERALGALGSHLLCISSLLRTAGGLGLGGSSGRLGLGAGWLGQGELGLGSCSWLDRRRWLGGRLLRSGCRQRGAGGRAVRLQHLERKQRGKPCPGGAGRSKPQLPAAPTWLTGCLILLVAHRQLLLRHCHRGRRRRWRRLGCVCILLGRRGGAGGELQGRAGQQCSVWLAQLYEYRLASTQPVGEQLEGAAPSTHLLLLGRCRRRSLGASCLLHLLRQGCRQQREWSGGCTRGWVLEFWWCCD